MYNKTNGAVSERTWLNKDSEFIATLNKRGYKVIRATEKQDLLGCDFWVVDMYNGNTRIPVDLTTSLESKASKHTLIRYKGMVMKKDSRTEWAKTGHVPVVPVTTNPTPKQMREIADQLASWVKIAI